MSSHEDMATLRALIAGVDQAAKTAEAKWGVDRLPLLVSTETREKFERQRAKWRFALQTAYEVPLITGPMLADCRSLTGGMERAWAAMDAEAEAKGAQPVSPEVWEVAGADGQVIAIVRTVAEAAVVTQTGRRMAVYTLDEIANVIAALGETMAAAKIQFPGARIVSPTDRSWIKHGEEIPF